MSTESIEVVIGSNVTLACSASGFHLPNITWTTAGPLSVRVAISESDVNETFLTSLLEISNTEQGDTGNYSCRAENGVGIDTGYIFLQVLGIRNTGLCVRTCLRYLILCRAFTNNCGCVQSGSRSGGWRHS